MIEILNERPACMSFEDYRQKRSESNARLRRYLKGRLYFYAVQLINIGSDKVPKWVRTGAQHNCTFVGKASKDLKNPI